MNAYQADSSPWGPRAIVQSGNFSPRSPASRSGCLQGFLPLSPPSWLWLNANQRFTIRSTSKRVARPTWVNLKQKPHGQQQQVEEYLRSCCCVWVRHWNGWRMRGLQSGAANCGAAVLKRLAAGAAFSVKQMASAPRGSDRHGDLGLPARTLILEWHCDTSCISYLSRSDHDAHVKVHPARGDNVPGLDAQRSHGGSQWERGDEVENREKKREERWSRQAPGLLASGIDAALRRRRLGVTGEAVCHPSLFGHSRW